MRTLIIYILIAAIVASIAVSAFPIQKMNNQQTITAQCIDNNFPPAMFNMAGEIIKSRLKANEIQDFDIMLDVSSSCINITANTADLKSCKSLITSKGKIEFYEVHDRSDVISDLEDNKELTTLLNIASGYEKLERFSGIIGYCKKDKKADIELFLKNYHLSNSEYGIKYCWGELPDSDGNYYLYALSHPAPLSNSDITETSFETDISDNNPMLMISFSEIKKSIWGDITKRNIDKSIAIVLDNNVLYAPAVKSAVKNGKCLLTGNFSYSEMKRINSLISNKELPLSFELKK